jgi:hypothetical protein
MGNLHVSCCQLLLLGGYPENELHGRYMHVRIKRNSRYFTKELVLWGNAIANSVHGPKKSKTR